MMDDSNLIYPGGSRYRINRAGDAVRAGNPTPGDIEAIETWRAAHRQVLNTFQAILRTRTRGTNIAVAQRHKRKKTIFDKLQRFPQMRLSRMDDIAGCRLIFSSINDLYEFRDTFLRARFKHTRKNELDKYDYIKSPKSTGYRGVHDIYEYDVNSDSGRALKGLYIEIQYRTLVQHAWATAVEVIEHVTECQPKFQTGNTRYVHAMALASEILARANEASTGPLPELAADDLVRAFRNIEGELNIIRTLKNLNAMEGAVSSKKNMILIMSDSGQLEVRTFRESPDALRTLFELERDMPDRDIVLVRAETSEEVRMAFRNYFSDAKEFISLIETGCRHLSDMARCRQPESLNNLASGPRE